MKIRGRTSLFLAAMLVFIYTIDSGAQTCSMESSFAPSNIDIPNRIVAGRSYRVRVNVFNDGTCMWHPRTIKLLIKVIRKPSGAPYPLEEFKSELDLKTSVPTKKTHTWFYEITAPTNLGDYELEWTMAEKSRSFGSQVRKRVVVVAP